jgi:hypothetical protein
MVERPIGSGLEDLESALSRLDTTRILDCAQAGAVAGVSRTLVDTWCRAQDPVPHDSRPQRRPVFLLSEREVLDYALRQPTTRKKALSALQARVSGAARGPGGPGTHDSAPDRISEWMPNSALSQSPAELGRLRGEFVRLQEQVAHLTGLVEELEASNGRKTAMWLAALRANTVPGTAAALDGIRD